MLSEILPDLAHDFKTYDPIGAGILNMVIGDSTADYQRLPLGMFPLAL